MKKLLLAMLILISGCATQSGEIPPTSTPSIALTQTILDYSTQKVITTKEKYDNLYIVNIQVIDNYLSLTIESLNTDCHTRGEWMEVHLTFNNLSQETITLSDRFSLAPENSSYYEGSDISLVFFSNTGKRLHPSGDFMFFDYTPGQNTFSDIDADKSMKTVLKIRTPHSILDEQRQEMVNTPAGNYFLKFIYWSAEVNREADHDFLFQKRAISSNSIAFCIE